MEEIVIEKNIENNNLKQHRILREQIMKLKADLICLRRELEIIKKSLAR